jgi:5-methylcytosine-specific restriction endonuclease McrBC GTP-binding regulatory subunit McrB
MQANIKDLFNDFIKGYNEKSKNTIWDEKSRELKVFWSTRIGSKDSAPLTDAEMDDIIRILDRNARGNTKDDEVVTRAMIPQLKWYKLFRDIKSNEAHYELINRIINEKDARQKAALLDKLFEINLGWKNHLTGASANGINTLLAGLDIFETLSIVSLNDRIALMTYLGHPDMAGFSQLSWGNKIVLSEKFILEQFQKIAARGNARTLTVFVYSDRVKPLWKINADETTDVEGEEEYEDSDYKNKSIRTYWLYAPGERASMWEQFYNDGVMRMGWPELGDLRQYKTKEEIQATLRRKHNADGGMMNAVLANYEFGHVMKPGDIVIAKRGAKEYIGYGVVTSEYRYDSTLKDYCSYRTVTWKARDEREEPDGRIVLKTLTNISKYPDYVDKLKKLLNIHEEDMPQTLIEKGKKPNSNLNTILYGPPGTGKTFSTIDKALACLGDDAAGSNHRPLQRERFDHYVQQGRIVFTTFHQSMSYEDFIEGIKPDTENATGGINYHVVDGVFKQCCARAAYLCYIEHLEFRGEKKPYTFDELYEAFTDELQDQLDKKQRPQLTTLTGKDIVLKEIKPNGSLLAGTPNSVRKTSASPLTKENIQKLYDRYKQIGEITNLNAIKETVDTSHSSSVFYAVFKDLKEFEQRFARDYNTNAEDHLEIDLPIEQMCKNFNEGVYTKAILENGKASPPVVIIIDEINRGNISQIFGELITLIESDKRLGSNEGMEVVLPYSKRRFGVPPNLYIIGTMNTADRSVEALDTALRRRFSFVEMPPNYTLDELKRSEYGVNIEVLLNTINDRIEKLLDRDHLIGHSYFMDKNVDLKETFQNKIIPLLQEYFFGDYGKIGLVLGKGFVGIKESSGSRSIFAEFPYEDSDELAGRSVYHIKWPIKDKDGTREELEKENREFEEALKQLMTGR